MTRHYFIRWSPWFHFCHLVVRGLCSASCEHGQLRWLGGWLSLAMRWGGGGRRGAEGKPSSPWTALLVLTLCGSPASSIQLAQGRAP